MSLLRNVHMCAASVCAVLALALIFWADYARNPYADAPHSEQIADILSLPNDGAADVALLGSSALLHCFYANLLAAYFLSILDAMIKFMVEIGTAVIRILIWIGSIVFGSLGKLRRGLLLAKIRKDLEDDQEVDSNPFRMPNAERARSNHELHS